MSISQNNVDLKNETDHWTIFWRKELWNCECLKSKRIGWKNLQNFSHSSLNLENSAGINNFDMICLSHSQKYLNSTWGAGILFVQTLFNLPYLLNVSQSSSDISTIISHQFTYCISHQMVASRWLFSTIPDYDDMYNLLFFDWYSWFLFSFVRR